jgi:predicted nucleic acid-binding protein
VSTLVIDASVAVKWVVEEDGTGAALALRRDHKFIAPELLVAECANILWKKAQRREMSANEALLAARLLEGADIELLPTRALLEAATRLAIELDHPAYDCLYLALAAANACKFVTADERLIHRLARHRVAALRDRAVSLADAAGASPPRGGR